MPEPDSSLQTWQRYYDQRKDIDNSAFEMGGRYDKLALAISGGGFILSVTFLEKVTQSPPFWVSCILIVAWMFFGSSIICHLFAARFSQQAQQYKIKDLDVDYLHDKEGTLRSDYSAMVAVGDAINRTQKANEIAIWTLIFGLIFMSLFAASAILCKKSKEVGSYEREETTTTTTTIVERRELRSSTAPGQPTQTSRKGEEKMNDDDLRKIQQVKESKGSYVPPPNAIKPPAPAKTTENQGAGGAVQNEAPKTGN